jgi:hypothetical protein
MQQETTITQFEGKPLYTSEGTEAGQIAKVFFDKHTRVPEWLSVRRGLLSGKQVLVPVLEASVTEDRISVPYSSTQIESAPEVEGNEVSQATEQALAAHYRIAYSKEKSATGLAEGKRTEPRSRTREHPTRSGSGDESRTREELYAEAKKLGIEGRSKMKKRELARAVDRARGSSPAGAGKANPVEVQKFLAAVDYPVRKRELIATAERQNAPAEVRATLERIRDEKFDDPADVSEAIGRLS